MTIRERYVKVLEENKRSGFFLIKMSIKALSNMYQFAARFYVDVKENARGRFFKIAEGEFDSSSS